MMDHLSRGEPWATVSTTLANMTRKSTRTFEHTLTIFETRDDVLTSTVFLTMKKYATVKSTSKSSVI